MNTLVELSNAAEEALDRFEFGQTNPEAIRYFETMENRKRAINPNQASEKITGMMVWAKILYSDRKHIDYDSGPISGADKVRMFLRQDLHVMRDIEQRSLLAQLRNQNG